MLGTLSQAVWRLGLGRKVLKAQGQETLWVPGTMCSVAGGSDVGAVLCSLLGECGPWVGCLCPLPGLCQWVLGWPTVALASKSRLGLPARGELYASPAVVGLRGRPGRRLGGAPRRLSHRRPHRPLLEVARAPTPAWVTGRLGAGRTSEPIASTLRSPRLTFLRLLRRLEVDRVQEGCAIPKAPRGVCQGLAHSV